MSKSQKHDGVVYQRKDGKILWIRYRDRNGKRCRESTQTEDWQEANRKLRERLQARNGNLLEVIRKGEALGFVEWVDSFLENYSRPPMRAAKTHEANIRCATHLKAAFSGRKLVDLTADAIEDYLRRRLRQRVRVKLAQGYREMGILKASTVHQEFRVLRRMLNIARIFVSTIFARPMPLGAECGRRGGRVGNANASSGRRASHQKVFADEVADEARGTGEAQSPRQRDVC
jgi:hypothetical protein